ncbi:MAG: PEGA domain-containing protein [Polyangiaceae bacterium]|nr:PEGA domain-containing protein [Polyangiaceae bacterium]
MVRRKGAWCLAFAIALAAVDAGADENPIEQAEGLIREGVALRVEGREAEALERFRKAHATHPSARALGQMGLASKSLRLYVQAEQCLKSALAEESDAWVVQNREALEQARDVVAKQLASLAVRSNVNGAEVWVNGARVATLPHAEPIRLPAGTARVELRAAGYRTATKEAQLPAESMNEMEIRLDANPLAAKPPAAGSQAPEKPPAPKDAEESPLRPWIWATLAFGSAGVTAGAALGGATIAKKNERDEVCPEEQCRSLRGVELDDELRTYATASTVMFAVGGSALVASLALWLAEEPWKPSVRAWLLPTLSPSSGGLTISGSF